MRRLRGRLFHAKQCPPFPPAFGGPIGRKTRVHVTVENGKEGAVTGRSVAWRGVALDMVPSA